ncbi:MAG TPA: hypothetical protein VFA44_05210 [Gaiellaceae bacterium]|nr:hypothetical protein [Gaiellaceae bacterium]
MDDWPPPHLRARAAVWAAERHMREGAYAAAAAALERGFEAGGELVRGLHHLAAAGCRAQEGDGVRARRQLERARARLQPFLPEAEEVDLRELVALVEREVGS